jgi:hypothetical protein
LRARNQRIIRLVGQRMSLFASLSAIAALDMQLSGAFANLCKSHP